jgi:CubicO group peptidase (beta-lactamase class C family)
MKKAAISITILLVIIFSLMAFIGISPAYIYRAPWVATGIGSKLLCSSYFVTGFSLEQSIDDLVQYSPLLDMLDIEVDENQRIVETSFFGLSTKTASFREGLGCSVDYPTYSQRASIITKSIVKNNAPWPLGSLVDTIDLKVQELVESQVSLDNEMGLNTRAIVVVKAGSIVAEAYGQGADAETPLLGWSMAKSLTSVMLGNLEMRGLIDLNGKAGFASWTGDGRSEIAISDLLTMTDGLDFSENYNPGDDATTMLFTSPSASDFTIARSLTSEPGTHFNYSSGTANLLARIYTDTLGGAQGAYDNYMDQIAGPLGFQNAVFEVDASGVFFGSSYLYASGRDWARLGEMMLAGGKINGERLVLEDWVQRATQPNRSLNQKAYGYQWWLNAGNAELRWADLPSDAYAANGNRQQSLIVIPSKGVVIVRLGWTAGRYPVNERFSEILKVTIG